MYLKNKPDTNYYVFDIEANGLTPDTIWCAVVYDLQKDSYAEYIGHEQIKKWSENVSHEKAVLVGHNALSYDVPVVNRLLKSAYPTARVVDTLVLSSLYHPHLEGGHSLEAYGERFSLPKLPHDNWTEFSPEMLERCRRDVEITVRTFRALRAKMNAIGFSELSCEIEHRIREVLDWQEEYGFGFNEPEARIFLAKLEDECKIRSDEVQKLFPPQLKKVKTCVYKIKKDGSEGQTLQKHRQEFPEIRINPDGTYDCYSFVPFNLGSPAQRVARLTEIGYVPVNFTKKGAAKVDEEGILAFLEDCQPEHKPAVLAMAEWLVVDARRRVLKEWLAAYNPATGAIHGTVWSCGAMSRRCAHNSPNTANIPSNEAKYGKECRSLWTARRGRRLVGGDAKSVQMRMFAHYLGNVEIGMEYAEGDPHQRNADEAGIPRKKVKNCFYAMIFGAKDPKLGITGLGASGTAADGARVRRALYKTTPGLEACIGQAEADFKRGNGWIECIDGGWVRCKSASAALNYKIQSAEAVLMKMVAVKVWRKVAQEGLDVRQVGFIHDELQYDCAEEAVDRLQEIFKDAMASAGRYLKFIIPMEGDTKVGQTWAETH